MKSDVVDGFVGARYRVALARPTRSAVLPRVWLTRAVLVGADLVALSLAAGAAVRIWSWWQPLASARTLEHMWPLAAVIPIGFFFLGLYPAVGVSVVQELRSTSMFVTAVFGSAVATLFLTNQAGQASRGMFLLAWLFMLAAIPSMRSLVRHLLARRRWWGVGAIIFGAGRTAELLLSRTLEHAGTDLKFLACFDDDPEKHGTDVFGVPVLGGLKDVAAFKRACNPKYAIVAMPGVEPDRTGRVVRALGLQFPHIVVIPNVFGYSTIGMGSRSFGGVVGLYDKKNLLLAHNRVLKRVLDLLLLVPLAVMALPFIALGALAVMLVDPGNPFYAQEREGRAGRPIRMWKLRTMRRDAEAQLERYLAQRPGARAEWERHFKLTHDPRVIPVVGSILRRTSIDELPQLLNILLGQMSVVGPRPFPYYHLEQFDREFRQLRSSVVPGLTGYWQVTSRSAADLPAQEQLDSYYIANWSLWLDVYILARTPAAVLFGKGAY